MLYDFKNFFRLQYHSLFKAEGKHFRLTPKRLGVLAIFYLVFPIVELSTWMALLLDEIFYPKYHNQKVMKPVFVIGNYRSGTTFLHRLLAMDKRSFTAMSGWEVFIAPSIIQRKIIHKMAAFDRFFGGHIYNTFNQWWQRNIQDHIDFHTIGVTEPEEDENLLAHIWSGIIPWNMFPIMEDGAPEYAKFDSALSEKDKKRVMNFYLRCIQRHLYTQKRGLYYLSKSPSFSGKVDSIYKTFPDAKIIYLVRNPIDVVPSQIHMWSFKWNVTCSPLEDYPYKDVLLDMIKYWYHHPLERLAEAPERSYSIVNFDDLTSDPLSVIEEIYEKFEFEMTPRYAYRIKRFTRKRNKRSGKKKYSLRKMGLTVRWVRKEFASIFQRFRFRKKTRDYLRLRTNASMNNLQLKHKHGNNNLHRFWRIWKKHRATANTAG